MNQLLSLTAAGLTDPGVQRQNNEDTWGEPPPNLTPELATAKGYLYVVADGVGGHQSGEVASRIAVQVTQQVYYADPNLDVGASLAAAIQEANRRIYHQGIGSAGEFGMSTTITAAVVRGSELVVANVGDSRTYLIHGGQPHQLTVDHTWVEERRQAGILTAQEAANHPQRNVITRSLGGNLEVQVDVFGPHPLVQGDQVLLCTDGLSDLVSDPEMAAVVAQSRNPNAAVHRLVDLAKKRGAPDNVTAVVVSTGRGKAGPGPEPSSLAVLAGVLGAVVLLAVAGFALIRPRLGVAPQATTTPAPTSSPTVTETPTLAATAAPLPTPALTAPEDGKVFPFQSRGEVTLSWSWGVLQPNQRFRVELWDETRRQEVKLQQPVVMQPSSFRLPDLHDGTYRWTVVVEEQKDCETPEKWSTVVKAGEWRFVVLPPPTFTPTPVPTPTETPTPLPPPTDDGGDDNGDDGGDEVPPVSRPTSTSS